MGQLQRQYVGAARGLRHTVLILIGIFLWHAPYTPPAHGHVLAQDEAPSVTEPTLGTVRVFGSLPATAQDDAAAPLTFALLDVVGALNAAPIDWVPASGQILGRPATPDAIPGATPAVTYTVDLPLQPAGIPVVLDGVAPAEDGAVGVQIFEAVAAAPLLGDGYLQTFEQRGGWRSLARDVTTGQIISGTLLIFAQDDGALFPESAGADGLLFTADDSLAPAPQGYSLATLGTAVTLTQPVDAVMPLLPPPAPAAVDLTALTLPDAYDALVDHLAAQAGLAADGAVDWADLGERFRPQVAEAAEDAADDAAEEPTGDAGADGGAYLQALAALAQAAGDGLVTVGINDAATPAVAQANAALQGANQGALGVEIAELDDGRLVVVYVAPGSQAATAGIKPGMELRAVNGVAAADALADAAYPGFPGSDEARHLAQVANVLRAPLDSEVTLELATPAGATQSVTLVAGQYPTRRLFSVAGQPMPASYRFLSNTGYLALADFDRAPLLLALVEDFLGALNARNGEGVIMDLRGNPGGSLAAMLTTASYFFSDDAPLDPAALLLEELDGATGELVARPWAEGVLAAPVARAAFTGPVTLLVDEGCRGACELMAALFQATGRGTVISQVATAGIAGDTVDVLLPQGIVVTYPTALWALGTMEAPIHGAGIQPDVRVPFTEESEIAKATGNDPLMAAALDYLDLVQLEPVPVAFDFVGVTSVGPRGWRFDEASRQLRRADGTGLTVIPQQGDDAAAAVAEFVGNFQGEADEVETLTVGERTWTLYAGTLFGQTVRIAATVEDGDTLLTVLFITNPAQADQLTDKVLLPFLENFTLDDSTAL